MATVAMLAVVTVGGAYRNDVVQAQRLASVMVTIKSDGALRHVRTAQTTVSAILKEAGVKVGPMDLVSPAADDRTFDGMRIAVVRVDEEIETVVEPLSFDTVKTFSVSIPPGSVRETRAGERGERVVAYRVRREDGRQVSRTVVSAEVTKRPVHKTVCIGSRGRYTSRGAFRSGRVLRMHATAYDPGPRSCGRYATGRTACGLRAGYGVVAVDPRVIPLGASLYIEGYGFAVAGDRGRAIKGHRIDLGYNSYREAMRFGRRSVVVHVLRK